LLVAISAVGQAVFWVLHGLVCIRGVQFPTVLLQRKCQQPHRGTKGCTWTTVTHQEAAGR
jgi:hypothetical protein